MPLITLANLQDFWRPSRVIQMFTDDGSSTPGPRLPIALQTASDEGALILGRVPAWNTDEQLQLLVDNDLSIRHAFCKLAMAIGGDSKPEWFAPGNENQPSMWRKDARTVLTDLAERRLRTKAEPVAGENTVNRVRVANARQFEFARRRGQNPSGGGF